MAESIQVKNGYSDVNGITMYYEKYGEGKPLVLIHGGGSTLQTSFGRIIPTLAKNRQVIAVELQAHGRSGDREAGLSFEQDADDVATLLQNLQVNKADILEFSNGGHATMEIALRHPEIVNKIILCSTFYKRNAIAQQFWEGFEGKINFEQMPQVYKDEFLKVNNDPAALLNMFNKDVQRMRNFKGWSDEALRSIKAPALVVNGDRDIGSSEHAVEMFRTIPDSRLAIIPGGHGGYMGEMSAPENEKGEMNYFVSMINRFLDEG